MLYVQDFSLLLFLCGSVPLCDILRKCTLLIVLYEKCRITKVKDNSKKGIIGEANAVGKLEGINVVDKAGRIKGIKANLE